MTENNSLSLLSIFVFYICCVSLFKFLAGGKTIFPPSTAFVNYVQHSQHCQVLTAVHSLVHLSQGKKWKQE